LRTAIDPIYQTQRVGIKEYFANVPDGTYAVSLYFAELVSNEQKEVSIYSLGNDAIKESLNSRVFNVKLINKWF
jgi:beta-galactosidase